MKKGFNILPAAVAGALCLGLGFVPASAQTKPAESTSKVKKVMLYNKIGGWVHVDGSADVKSVMNKLKTSKKFELTELSDDAGITLSYLQQFQVIVWNNNTNGGTSVPNTAARKAVIDYVNAGGGWMLIHGAGDHSNSWADLSTTLGTTFTRHGNQGPADAIIDPEAKAHKELKWMVSAIPATIRLTDEWYSFQNTVRKLPGVTVVATAKAGTVANVVVPVADGTNDLTYIWAREVGKGRMLYTAIGHGQNSLMAQADSVVPKFYWENLRYAAGDFENGCTNANASNYKATARVDDGTCSTTSVTGPTGATKATITVVGGKVQTELNFPHGNRFSVELRDARGALVWNRVLENTSEVRLDRGLRAGVYHLTARDGKNVLRHRFTVL